jgi:transposase
MKAPLFVRQPTAEEDQALETALRSPISFTLRRAQIVRLSAQGRRAREIAQGLGCCVQTVRNAIHAFNHDGTDGLRPGAPGPKDPERIFDEEKQQRLLGLAHQPPRHFAKARSTWTLSLLAEVAFEEGLTEHEVSHETIRQAIEALGVSWQRAKDWIESPDPQYALKKNSEIA